MPVYGGWSIDLDDRADRQQRRVGRRHAGPRPHAGRGHLALAVGRGGEAEPRAGRRHGRGFPQDRLPGRVARVDGRHLVEQGDHDRADGRGHDVMPARSDLRHGASGGWRCACPWRCRCLRPASMNGARDDEGCRAQHDGARQRAQRERPDQRRQQRAQRGPEVPARAETCSNTGPELVRKVRRQLSRPALRRRPSVVSV